LALKVGSNALQVPAKNVNLEGVDVFDRRAIHACHVARGQSVRIDQSHVTHTQTHELLGDRGTCATATNDADMEIAEGLLYRSSESTDASVEDCWHVAR
jgi:hypothetical protein